MSMLRAGRNLHRARVEGIRAPRAPTEKKTNEVVLALSIAPRIAVSYKKRLMKQIVLLKVANFYLTTASLEIGSTAGGAARGLSPPTSSYKGGAKASNAAARNVH